MAVVILIDLTKYLQRELSGEINDIQSQTNRILSRAKEMLQANVQRGSINIWSNFNLHYKVKLSGDFHS